MGSLIKLLRLQGTTVVAALIATLVPILVQHKLDGGVFGLLRGVGALVLHLSLAVC
jgi:hypothetical protein